MQPYAEFRQTVVQLLVALALSHGHGGGIVRQSRDHALVMLRVPDRSRHDGAELGLRELVQRGSTGGNSHAAMLAGASEGIPLLEHVVGGTADEHLLDTLLPKDIAAFRARAEKRRTAVEALLKERRELVERIERLVCAVYDVPDDLTEQVVAHAVRRAG